MQTTTADDKSTMLYINGYGMVKLTAEQFANLQAYTSDARARVLHAYGHHKCQIQP